MQYKLNWCDSVKAIFISNNKAFSVLSILLFIMPIIICRFYVPEDDFIIWLIVVFGVIMPLVLFAIQNFQSGWRIEEDILEIKAFTIKRKIKISLTQIALIGKESEWSPQFRICGVGISGLLAGKCRLRNKKQAVVFQHLEQSEQLLIETNGEYYLIGHIGIENLYNQLIELGAKVKDFEILSE
ncbi:PH domain-containing protein [Anaerosinus sp.]|uniref:PH domain-containing protein n=1 Tax=Selenobaculum sp. TaxID=3074374 RepID=UPI003AB1857C